MARPVLPLNGSYHKVGTEIADTKVGHVRQWHTQFGAKETACDILSNNSLPKRIYFDSNTKKDWN